MTWPGVVSVIARDGGGELEPLRFARHDGTSGAPAMAAIAIEAVRLLIETTTLPQRAVAARVGVSQSAVSRLVVRHGWTRPVGTRQPGREGGRPFSAETLAAARALVEGSRLGFTWIGRQVGVSPPTLCRWARQHGWARPADAPRFLPGPRSDGRPRPFRSLVRKGRPYATDAVEGVRRLATRTLLPQAAIARQVGISQERVSAWIRRRGWKRPLVRSGSLRFAAAIRQGATAEGGDRRGRPYAASVAAEARLLYEHAGLPTAHIGARLGAHPVTIARWARRDGWRRPRDAMRPDGTYPVRRRGRAARPSRGLDV